MLVKTGCRSYCPLMKNRNLSYTLILLSIRPASRRILPPFKAILLTEDRPSDLTLPCQPFPV